MGIHDWIDVANGAGLVAVTLLAGVLSARLARHDQERRDERREFEELKTKVSTIEGFLRGAFKF